MIPEKIGYLLCQDARHFVFTKMNEMNSMLKLNMELEFILMANASGTRPHKDTFLDFMH